MVANMSGSSDAVFVNTRSAALSNKAAGEGSNRDETGTSIDCRSNDSEVAATSRNDSDVAATSRDEDKAGNNSSATREPDPLPPHSGVVNSKEVDMVLRFHHCFLVFDDTTYLNLTSVKDGKFKLWRSHISEVRENWLDRYYKYRPSALNPRGKDEKAKRRRVTTVYAGFVKLIVAEFILGWNVDYAYETAGNGRLLPIHPDVERIYRSRLFAEKTLAGDRPISNKSKKRKALVLKCDEEPGGSVGRPRAATEPQNINGADGDLPAQVLPEPRLDKRDGGGSKCVHAEVTMSSEQLDGVGLIGAPISVSSFPPTTTLGFWMKGGSLVGAQPTTLVGTTSGNGGISTVNNMRGRNGDTLLHHRPFASSRNVTEVLGQNLHGLGSGSVSSGVEALPEGGREENMTGNAAGHSIMSEVLKQKNGPKIEGGGLETLVADLRLRLEEQEKRIQNLERRVPCVEVIALEGLVDRLKNQLVERDRRISLLESKVGTREMTEALPKSNIVDR